MKWKLYKKNQHKGKKSIHLYDGSITGHGKLYLYVYIKRYIDISMFKYCEVYYNNKQIKLKFSITSNNNYYSIQQGKQIWINCMLHIFRNTYLRYNSNTFDTLVLDILE